MFKIYTLQNAFLLINSVGMFCFLSRTVVSVKIFGCAIIVNLKLKKKNVSICVFLKLFYLFLFAVLVLIKWKSIKHNVQDGYV